MDKRLTPWLAWCNEAMCFWPTREWAEEDARQMIADGSRGVIVAQVVMQSVDDGGTEVLQPIDSAADALEEAQSECDELRRQLAEMTEERDELRDRLEAHGIRLRIDE